MRWLEASGARRFSRRDLALMAAMAVAAATDEVLRELPHISQTEATQYVTELRKMMKNWGQTFGGTDLMVERIYKAAPKAMPIPIPIPAELVAKPIPIPIASPAKNFSIPLFFI